MMPWMVVLYQWIHATACNAYVGHTEFYTGWCFRAIDYAREAHGWWSLIPQSGGTL
jgi:hypothetical protein